jgi:uncharacterized phage protein (TIGR01671 family)
MREIKFRGLRVDGAGWVYGYYLVKAEKHIIWSREDIQQFYVKPKSVGQFTGLQDKNGVDIYEGDKIEVCNNKNCFLTVVFVNEYVGGLVLIHESTKHKLSLGARKQSEIEVIGNIHQS